MTGAAADRPSPLLRGWTWLNRWTGLAAFGFPAVAALLGLAATAHRFGAVAALVNVGPAATTVVLPAAIWVADMIRPVRPSRRRLLWCAVLAVIMLGLARTPAGFAVGPCLLVVASETARTVTDAARHRTRTQRGPRRPLLPFLRQSRPAALRPSRDRQ